MSFRNRSGKGSRIRGSPSSQNITGYVGNVNRNYVSEQSGSRRHEISADVQSGALTTGSYVTADVIRFRRSFGAGSDDEPTATASNNYQNNGVMNGSKIVNLSANFKLQNNSGTAGVYVDVYAITCSFSDGHWMDTVYSTESPVEMQTGTNADGQVVFKSAHVTWTENTFKNYRGLQRNIKFLGTIYLSSNDGGQPSAEFQINGVPPVCRRSQTGMFYGLMFHNSAIKNAGASIDINIDQDTKFNEIPSSNRLPYKW